MNIDSRSWDPRERFSKIGGRLGRSGGCRLMNKCIIVVSKREYGLPRYSRRSGKRPTRIIWLEMVKMM